MINVKKIIYLFFTFCLVVILAVFIINSHITSSTSNGIYTKISEIPSRKVGLLLGTSKYISQHQLNLYYTYRIEAAVKLFKSGQIKYILISGDNGSKNYNEPEMMKKDLMKNGIPEDKIFLDYAGFRTLDSVLRAHKIFGLKTFTVISQKFHNERALYLAKNFGIHAIAFNAQDVNINYGFKTQLREKLARTKMMLDLVFGVQPKYLGDKIKIE
ncbi:SanA/YdcF family protein [Mesonia aestuariivivens]|uniref:YdcF family protein n=1 Tax=Mesonia aestuariivivens TaxID=2796128 RepID=A0ABS6VZR0_9FLAO|nr:ElyC/SanA/YdcF family protein [Mesonia aestuariivivens]MBW2961090.1 YdcF family protein [Mesonia aestuariivivens]